MCNVPFPPFGGLSLHAPSATAPGAHAVGEPPRQTPTAQRHTQHAPEIGILPVEPESREPTRCKRGVENHKDNSTVIICLNRARQIRKHTEKFNKHVGGTPVAAHGDRATLVAMQKCW